MGSTPYDRRHVRINAVIICAGYCGWFLDCIGQIPLRTNVDCTLDEMLLPVLCGIGFHYSHAARVFKGSSVLGAAPCPAVNTDTVCCHLLQGVPA